MIPPGATGTGRMAGHPETPPAVSVCLEVMKTRPQFLATAKGARQAMPGLVVQSRDRGDDDPVVHVGFTCSKKVGNAVARNRAKRRLRAAAQAVMPHEARPGWDYVLIGRAGATAELPFDQLTENLIRALAKIHGVRK